MKLAIVNSKGLEVCNLSDYIPSDVSEIIIGRADGASLQAVEYARENEITVQVFLPQHQKYRQFAQRERNIQIAQQADLILAFWDGSSPDIQHLAFYCHETGTLIRLYVQTLEGSFE